VEQILQNINFLNTIELDIWRNTLETDYQGAEMSFLLREDYIRFISSIAPVIRTTIFELNDWQSIEDLPDPLPNQFKNDVRILGILKEFTSRLNKEIVLEYLKENLEANNYLEIVENTGQAKRIFLALLLADNLSTELLQQLLLISRYERFGYQDYTLIMDLENVVDPRRQAELRTIEAQGIANPNITNDIVNELLQNYESSNSTGLNSICLKVIFYNNEFIVFILRESQRGGLRTFEEFIVGMNADLIVLRFSANLKDLKVRAVDTVKEDVYQAISNDIVKSIDPSLTPNYVKSGASNTETVINNFIQAIINEEIDTISLYSLEIVNSPLPGRPSISFQKTSDQISLSESLGYQGEDHVFPFSEIISHSEISKIKITFFYNRKSHIFSFKLRKIGEVSYVFISGQGGGIKKRKLLIDLLNHETGIRLLESKE